MTEQPIIHTDGRKMCKFLAQLAEALDAAGHPTAEAFAEFYGFTSALGWVAGMLEHYAANPPIEVRVALTGGCAAEPEYRVTAAHRRQ